jgi:hypothetical protein
MQPWKKYEETSRLVLEQVKHHFGLASVEGPQSIPGTLTPWAIEAKGVEADSGGTVVIECRLRTRRQNQEAIGALAFRIQDTSAVGGIIVTPLPLQKGASAIADGTRIQHVMLDPKSTPSDFAFKFLGNLFLGVPSIGNSNLFGTHGISSN